jgi:hypothetical protein
MNRRKIQKKIFAFCPLLNRISRVSLKVMPVLYFLILLLQFFVLLLQLFNKDESGSVVILVLHLFISVLETLTSFFQLFH